jgi:hypothetical protein
MILNDKPKKIDYRLCNILINPNLRSLDENTRAPSEKGMKLRWIIPVTIMFLIVVINAIVKIYAGM